MKKERPLEHAIFYVEKMIESLHGNLSLYCLGSDNPEFPELMDKLEKMQGILKEKSKTISRAELKKMITDVEDISICAFPPPVQNDPVTGEPPPIN